MLAIAMLPLGEPFGPLRTSEYLEAAIIYTMNDQIITSKTAVRVVLNPGYLSLSDIRGRLPTLLAAVLCSNPLKAS
jgi:hypothetical protein